MNASLKQTSVRIQLTHVHASSCHLLEKYRALMPPRRQLCSRRFATARLRRAGSELLELIRKARAVLATRD